MERITTAAVQRIAEMPQQERIELIKGLSDSQLTGLIEKCHELNYEDVLADASFEHAARTHGENFIIEI